MSQLGEQVLIAAIADLKGECPFCVEKSDDKSKPTLEVSNDSEQLGDNLRDPLYFERVLPQVGPRSKRPVVKSDYESDSGEAKAYVAFNAHHVIPGNASFAKVEDLHRWLAWEVKVEKRWFKELKPRRKATGTRRYGTTADGTEHRLVRLVDERTKSGAWMRDIKTTSGNQVYGIANYDINCEANGLWLPSNNAIENWSSMTPQFQRAYAKRAMVGSGRQFHDAHPTYSKSVRLQLKNMEIKASSLAQQCVQHPKSDTKPWPALGRLVDALNRLSKEIARTKLTLRQGIAVQKDWATSRFAVGFRLPK